MTTMNARKSVVVIAVLSLLVTACGDGDPGSTTGAEDGSPSDSSATGSIPPLPDEPNPASIDVALDPTSAVSATIGFDGGSLRATGPDGAAFDLVVPPRALFSDIEITMTPIVGATGEVIGDTFIAGVNLEPSGLHFLELVTLEITSPEIAEDSLAFGAETGGEDFHLTPSSPSSGSITIGITHFTEYGAAEEAIGKLVEQLVPVGHEARAAHELARGGSPHALDAATRYANSLAQNTPSTFAQWGTWTGDVISLLVRVSENVTRHGWALDTPGYQDLVDALRALVDTWFSISEMQVQSIGDRCSNGDIDAFFELVQILNVAAWIEQQLAIDASESKIRPWFDTAVPCLQLGVLWQAEIATTSSTVSAADFYSLINVGSEITPSELLLRGPDLIQFLVFGSGQDEIEVSIGPYAMPLEVEYLEGFWDNCLGLDSVPGSARMELKVVMSIPNVGVGSGRFTDMRAFVEIVEDVFIECSAFEFSADGQAPFHGEALRQMNADRENGGVWEFPLVIDPGGGLVAQLEEEVGTLTWSEGRYELYQLLTVYVGAQG